MPLIYYLPLLLPFLGQEVRDAVIIQHCNSLPRCEAIHYILTLGTRENRSVLRKLYSAEGSERPVYAALVAASTFEDEDIVQFCREFKVGSANWVSVFETLEDRPKAKIIAYIEEVCKTGDAQTRYHCYRVCLAKSWGDLIKYARADHDNATIVESVFGGVALSVEAGLYVEEFDKKKDKK
jgi:hypothetical protein